MKKCLIFLLLFTVFNVDATGTGNRFTNIEAFSDQGKSYLRLEYDYAGVYGNINLRRAVQPNGNFMPMAPGEVVEIFYQAERIIWILSLEKLGRQRTFIVVVTP